GIAGWQIVSGNNAGDHDIRLTTIRPNTNWDAIWADAELSRRHPDFLYDHYSGNHYRWQNDFSATDHEMVRVNWQEFFGKEMKFHSVLSAAYHSYSNLLYFDSAYQIPQQYNGTITAYEIRLKLFGGVGPVRTLTDATFNSIASSSPIHLPKYIVRESLYGEFNLFKNALLLQTGIDATYFSSFYCDAYNANLSQFFVQNSYSTSDYVYLDVWLAMKIKPVRIFVKADNVNSFISGKRYMLVPHAPQNDFCMKFGVSWVFND
ncbi:MAG TPA: putative porin, partial [Bacteroidia bacterium]|nr:putative porin [Bacteroidia bacterium]